MVHASGAQRDSRRTSANVSFKDFSRLQASYLTFVFRILASENTVSLEIKKVHRIFLEKYSNEEEIRKIVETSHATSESIGYRKIVRTGVKKRRWSSKLSSNR